MVADGEGARAQALLLRRFRGSDTATTEGHRIPGATRRAQRNQHHPAHRVPPAGFL